MKMKKWLLGCLLLVLFISITPSASAAILYDTCSTCGKITPQTKTGIEPNETTHLIAWVCNECGTVKRAGGENHSGGTADCDNKPICALCGAAYGNALGHQWEVTYQWTGYELSGCTAHGVCKRNAQHNVYEAAIVTTTFIEPTCSTPDQTTRTATFTISWAETQVKTVSKGVIWQDAHRWGDTTYTWSPDYATCTAKRVCTLNSSHSETEVATATSTTLNEATCTTDGKTEHTAAFNASWASTQTKTVEIPALTHDLEQHEAKAATCTEIGWNAYETCKREGCTYTTRVDIPALNHDLVCHDAKEPTCTEKGWNAYEACQREGCTYTTYEDSEAMRALGHDFTVQERDTDTHWKKCSRCDAIDGKEEHTWDVGKITVQPTCLTAGEKVFTCTKCSATKAETLGASGHDLVRHDAQAPTCTEIGWEAYDTCKREGCNYTSYKELPALNHDLVPHDGKAPTCTEKGWSDYDTCTRCDYTTYTEIPIDAKSHDLSHVKAQAPTCTNHGWEAYDVCKRCGYNTVKELPALGHWYGEWTPNGSHTHLASCKRGCGQRAATTCAALDYALLAEGADAYEFTLCPVCGEVSDGALLKLIDQTTAQPLTRWLPAGEQVLRLGTLENGEILLTAAFEISGQLTQPTGQVQFTLPAEHLEGFTLNILHADGTEEPLLYTVTGKTATFTLDFTSQEVPAMTLRLTPEA